MANRGALTLFGVALSNSIVVLSLLLLVNVPGLSNAPHFAAAAAFREDFAYTHRRGYEHTLGCG